MCRIVQNRFLGIFGIKRWSSKQRWAQSGKVLTGGLEVSVKTSDVFRVKNAKEHKTVAVVLTVLSAPNPAPPHFPGQDDSNSQNKLEDPVKAPTKEDDSLNIHNSLTPKHENHKVLGEENSSEVNSLQNNMMWEQEQNTPATRQHDKMTRCAGNWSPSHQLSKNPPCSQRVCCRVHLTGQPTNQPANKPAKWPATHMATLPVSRSGRCKN